MIAPLRQIGPLQSQILFGLSLVRVRPSVQSGHRIRSLFLSPTTFAISLLRFASSVLTKMISFTFVHFSAALVCPPLPLPLHLGRCDKSLFLLPLLSFFLVAIAPSHPPSFLTQRLNRSTERLFLKGERKKSKKEFVRHGPPEK